MHHTNINLHTKAMPRARPNSIGLETDIYDGVETSLTDLHKVVSSYDSLPALMSKISKAKAEVNAKHNSSVHQQATSSSAQMGKRFSYSGRGAQTSHLVGSTHQGSAAAGGGKDNEHEGHFEPSRDLTNQVTSVVSQLDALKSKIAEERRLALEKKRTRRPVLPSRSVEHVTDKVNKYLKDKVRKEYASIDPKKGRNMTADEISTIFQPFDTNKDGRLSYPDFKTGLRGLHVGLTDEECESFAQWVDDNQDGIIDTDELKAKLRSKQRAWTGAEDFNEYPQEEKKEEPTEAPTPTAQSTGRTERLKSLQFGVTPTPDTPGTPTLALTASDLKSYENNTNLDESYDYVQGSRFSPPVKRFAGQDETPLSVNIPDSAAQPSPKVRTSSVSFEEDSVLTPAGNQTEAPELTQEKERTESTGDWRPELDELLKDQGRWATHEAEDHHIDVPVEQLLKTRNKIERSNQEYGLFSPIHKTNTLTLHDNDGDVVRSRLGTYYQNTLLQKTDHVADILQEDKVAEADRVERIASQSRSSAAPSSPMHATREKFKTRGKKDHIGMLISSGPQPEFAATETERKLLLKERLKQRGEESMEIHLKEVGAGINPNRDPTLFVAERTNEFNKTYSSHLSGAAGIVNDDAGHHNRVIDVKIRSLTELQGRSDLSDDQKEALHEKLYDQLSNKKVAAVDHLSGSGAVVPPPPPTFKASTKIRDNRTKDLKKTERMILARLAGSGSVPALEQALKKADGSRSGVLNKEEFKRAMVRFGIELEPGQLDTVMSAMSLNENTVKADEVGKAALLDNYETLNHKYMQYDTFLDNLDSHQKELHFEKEMQSTAPLNSSKKFSATGQAQLHPGKHQGRRVCKKVLSKVARLQRGAIESVLSSFDSSKIGLVKPVELRAGLNALGVVCSDKEFRVLKEEVLGERNIEVVRGNDDVRFSLSDVMPAVEAFTSICETDDFEAIKGRNEALGSGNNFRSSTVVYPEMPQAKVLSREERKERVATAKIAKAIGENDAKVMQAFQKSGGATAPLELQKVLGEAGLQISTADADILSRNLIEHTSGSGLGGDNIGWGDFCRGLKIKSNIVGMRTDKRTGKMHAGVQRNMRASGGVLRSEEELSGGIFARSTHRGTVDTTIDNESDNHLNSMYHNEVFDARMRADSMVHLSTKKGGSHLGSQEHFFDSSKGGSMIGGNRKKSPTFGMNQARDHIGVGMKEIGNGDGRISPNLIGNRKGETEVGRRSKVGSVGNLLVENSIGGEAGGFKALRTSPDMHTAHGKPYTHGDTAVMSTPNKRRSANKQWSWAQNSVGSLISDAGGGTPSRISEEVMRSEEVMGVGELMSTPNPTGGSPPRGRTRSVTQQRNQKRRSHSVQALPTFGPCASPTRSVTQQRNQKRRSHSVQALPTFGPCASPYATLDDLNGGVHSNKRELRPGADGSLVVQNYFQNASPRGETRAPFALEGDRMSVVKSGKKVTGAHKLYGIGAAQGFNIISNEVM
ncbi:hypothetical protein TL16_g11800 [Triparma laevis f. inornata]|uniref:EF-hand domain-containing protein n=1 Tax=Triparma laevis f. inornata TaxID=1714386 RepID=A0A9W7ETY5_9STRA|nr:hypothetical protein TL16_g11800 [Triparma laevis f. inornata]